MNSEIEQRIVAMYFDNKDFEKNAKQTIDTLGELKSNLNLENSVKGFDELDKAGKKLNLNQARTTIKNMKEALGGMEGALKKAFNIGTAPIHALDNFFGTFRSYVGKFVGFDLASKFVGSLESAMRQLTVAPIEAGWSMYQANIDSTKTIMSGTLKSYKEKMSETSADWTYDEEDHMNFVKGQLAELSRYAQQTVFSLSDMTANVGKFTNNNIDLETSVTAMEGIANMTAKAGQGAQQASMAMYNFSQALGVGKMTTIDWKSIENANLATTELKQLFIDTAEASGKLTKEVTKMADGKEMEKFFITVDKNGKKLARNKWIEVSAENFRDSLSNGWLDKETMLRVFQIYSGQVSDVDIFKSWGFEDDQINYLMEIGEEATKAATQVRTFQKMWDAMTEAVQSGWADSMQFIFGDMLEATEFWSTINDKIGAVLDASSEKRNTILREWRGLTHYNEETKEWERIEGAIDGREDLIQAIYGTVDALKDIGAAFKKAWSDVFGEMTGKRMQEITKGFRDLVDRFREWLGTTEDEGSRISKLSRALRGIFNIIKIVVNVIKAGFGVVKKLVSPVADIFIDLFNNVLGFFDGFADLDFGTAVEKLKDGIVAAWEAIKEFFKPSELIAEDGTVTYGDSPFTAAVNNFFQGVADTIHGWMDDLGLQDLWGHLTTAWDWIKDVWNKITKWSGWTAIATFFTDTWTAIRNFFVPSVSEEGEGIGKDQTSPFIKGITDAWETVKDAWNKVTGWKGWKEIGAFGTSIWSAIVNFFAPKEVKNAKGKVIGTSDSPFIAGIKGIWNKIKGAWSTVVNWEGWEVIGNFFSDVWGWIMDRFNVTVNWIAKPVTDGKTGFVIFIEEFAAKVSSVWASVVGWEGWEAIGNFFVDIWKWISEKFTGAINWFSEPVADGKTGFVLFIEDFAANVSRIWASVVGWEGWEAIGNFFVDIWKWISDKFTGAINWISTPVTDGKTGFVIFLEEFAAKVSSVWATISGWEGWEAISDFFSNIWNKIIGFFHGGEQTAEAAAEVGESTEKAAEALPVTQENVGILQQIIDVVSGFVKNIADALGGVVIDPKIEKILNDIWDFITGFLTFFTDVLGKIGRLLGGNAKEGDWVAPAIIGLIAALGAIVNYFHTKNLSGIETESLSSRFFHIAMGIAAMAAAVALLTALDEGKMWKAVGAVAVLGLVVAAIMVALNKLTDTQRRADTTTSTERVLTKLIGSLEKIGMIAVAMALLPNIIKSFGEAKKLAPELTGDDFLKLFLGLAGMIAGISVALALVNKISGNQGIDPKAALKTAISVVAFLGTIALGFLGAGGILELVDGIVDKIAGKDVDTTGAISGALDKVAEFAKGIGKVFNEFVTGLFGIKTDAEKQNAAMNNLNALANSADKFNFETTSGIMRILNMIAELSKVTKDLDTSKMSTFENDMEQVARGVLKFSWIFDGIDNIEGIGAKDSDRFKNFQGAVDLVKQLLDAFDGLKGFGMMGSQSTFGYQIADFIEFTKNDQKVKDFVDGVNRILESMGGLNDGSNVNFDGISIIKKMYDAIQTSLNDPEADLPEFNALPIVDDLTTTILQSLGYGSAAISLAVHEMVQAGIDKSGKGENGSGYKFNESEMTGFLDFLNNPENGLGQGTMNTDELTKWLYGEGGSAENPSADSPLGLLGGFKDQMEEFEFPDISGKFQEAFKFTNPETGEDMDITKSLTDTISQVEEKINGMSFEIKIVPTFDLSNLNSEVLKKTLGDYPVRLPLGNFTMPDTIQVDMASIAGSIDVDGLKVGINGVTAAVNMSRASMVQAMENMGNKILGLRADILRLKLYLDTGALVGGITPMIDRELGKRSAAADYTGVSPILSKPYYTVER